jgi:hypothetical protein
MLGIVCLLCLAACSNGGDDDEAADAGADAEVPDRTPEGCHDTASLTMPTVCDDAGDR